MATAQPGASTDERRPWSRCRRALLLANTILNQSPSKPASPPLLARPLVRWIVSASVGFFVAAVIMNLALPMLVDIDTPQWFMTTFPVFGGPVLWLVFGYATNLVIKARFGRSRSDRSAG